VPCAIAPRRPAAIADGIRGLRSCDDRERCARLREIVIHERTGLLFPVDDVPALADLMVRIAGDRQLRAHYAIAARELVVEKFAADIIGRQTVQLYRSLLETGGITQ
jgi:hypothetical protein